MLGEMLQQARLRDDIYTQNSRVVLESISYFSAEGNRLYLRILRAVTITIFRGGGKPEYPEKNPRR